ncbi:pentatricopeptide repeat-containing protein [Tanacetum coccineum]
MGQNGVLGDEYTFSTLAKVCGVVGDLGVGKWVHGKCIKYGLVSDSVVGSSLMSMYGKCGGREDLCRVFEEMPKRSVSSWNVMLSRCVDGENGEKAFSFVKCMLMEGLKPNEFTLSNLLPLCGSGLVWGRFDYGRELHCYIIRNEMNIDVDSSVHLDCCLIDMYSRRCKVSLARVIFDRMRFKNVFAWTEMMSGYLQNGDPDETVLIFREMLRRRLEMNEVTLLTLLPACSLVGGLLGVEEVHEFSVKKGFANHTSLCNSLIDMYSKNGLLSYAVKVFDHGCFSKDAISWSSIISGYGLHGKGQEAVALYDKMLTSGIKPDAISVVGVLSACSRSGLVEKGLDVYDKAINVYGIEPTMEMCSCVVDLLGRSGQLDEALSFIKTMRLEPGPSVWGAFVSACMVHADHETRVLAYKALIEVEPENPSNYAF